MPSLDFHFRYLLPIPCRNIYHTGTVEDGEKVYACFQAYDDDCASAINGEEKEPRDIYQGSNDGSQLPQCDGSFKDCIYKGNFCKAGSTEHKCEIED